MPDHNEQQTPPPGGIASDMELYILREEALRKLREAFGLRWSRKLPVVGGFYYWQNAYMRSHWGDNAVHIVQVSKYRNREGFNAVTLITVGDSPNDTTFRCDLDKAPPGWWAGPLPQPSGKKT